MPTPQRQPAAAPAELTRAPTKTHPLAPAPARGGEDETTTRMLCARVPVELHDEVKLLAVRRRTSVQAIVTAAIGAYLST